MPLVSHIYKTIVRVTVDRCWENHGLTALMVKCIFVCILFEIKSCFHYVKTKVMQLSWFSSNTFRVTKNSVPDREMTILKIQSFHSVFLTKHDLCQPSVIHTDSTKLQHVTLSQEIISGFDFHLHFQVSLDSFITVILCMILGSSKHPSIDTGHYRHFLKVHN